MNVLFQTDDIQHEWQPQLAKEAAYRSCCSFHPTEPLLLFVGVSRETSRNEIQLWDYERNCLIKIYEQQRGVCLSGRMSRVSGSHA